jgi:general transcription factor 3C polypeptide 6
MAAPTSLCPGFRHVEEFDPSEEYESGEEVSYVTFDLGNIEPTLVPSSSTYRLIVSELELPPLRLSHRDTENRGSILPLLTSNYLGLF